MMNFQGRRSTQTWGPLSVLAACAVFCGNIFAGARWGGLPFPEIIDFRGSFARLSRKFVWVFRISPECCCCWLVCCGSLHKNMVAYINNT